MNKRFLALLLCVSLLCSVLPVSVWATSETTEDAGAIATTDWTEPETTEETIPEATEETVPDTTEETTSETVPEATEETIPEVTEETPSETTPEAIPETTEETTSEPSDETAPGTPEDTVADTIGDTVAGIIVGAIEELEICPECGLIGEHTPECPNAAVNTQAVPTTAQTKTITKASDFPANGMLENNTTYKLGGNITSCHPLYVKPGYNVVIDLNNRMLQGTGANGQAVITVQIADSTTDSSGNIITGSNPGNLWIINSKELGSNSVGGSVNADGVWIQDGGDSARQYGAFIHNLNGIGVMVTGNLYMENCAVIGCQSNERSTGAAVCGTSTATIELYKVDVYYNRTNRTFNYSTTTNAFTTTLGWGGVVHSEQDYRGTSPSLTMTDCKVYSNTSSSLGGGISGGNITLKNCHVYDNKAYMGGGVCASKNLTISGGSIYNNTAVDRGGGIYCQRSCIQGINISNCSVYKNTLTGTRGSVIHEGYDIQANGGGIYLENTSRDHRISNCTIEDNTAPFRGGGVFVVDNCLLTVSGGTIASNVVDNCGGGIYNEGDTTLTGGVTVSNNTAGSNGAGLYTTDYATLINATIQGNISGGSGGGVYACYIDVPENGNIQVLENRANNDAGGLGATRYFSLLGNCTIQGNRAETGNGGGVYRYGQKYGHPNPITGKSIISGNYAGANGGGVYVGWHICTVSNGTQITNNIAGGSGGGVFIKGTARATDGGASNLDDPDAQTTLITENATITGNTAATGGAIYAEENGILVFNSNTTIDSNRADSYGGVHCGKNGSLTMSAGVTVDKNTATTGLAGGIFCDNGSTVTINGGSISGNEATASNGGGIYYLGSSLSISNATISKNKTPDGYGAGLFVGAGGSVPISNTKFSENIAKENGGGIYGGSNTKFTVTESEFTGNSANNGGGVYQDADPAAVANTTLTLDNTHFNGNTATQLGGGVYTEGTVTATNGCEFGSTAANNAGQTGGAIYGHTNAVITVTGGEIANNTATTGGGIGGVTGSQITVNGTQVTNNTASAGDGGGIYCQTDGSITVTDATITGNKSLGPDNQHGGRGGGIYCGPNTPLSVTNTDVSDNEAYVQGGGIWIGTNVTATLNGVTVTGNKILTQTPGNDLGTNFHASGGGIYTNGTNLIVDGDSQITGNTALYWGGGIYAGNKVTLKGNTLIENNSTTNNGGGVYSTGTADVSGNVVFRNNSAHSGGGLYAAHVIITGTESNPILFAQNHALVGSGGGISATQDATIQYVTAENNDAVVYGGGIYCHMNDEVGATFNYSIANSTVSNNEATGADSAGGGIFLQGTTTVTNCTVSGNTAIQKGGGIYVTGTATITGGEIKTNRAGVFGGGVCVAAKATLNMSDTLVDGNDAIEMLANTPLDNKNTGRGGGICVIGTAEFTNVTLQNNRALRYGGGLHVWDGGNATWHSGTIQKNVALYGGAGGIHAEDAQITIKNATITENEADEVGGGIHVNDAKLIIESANITENIVHAGGGGGIHANVGSELEIHDGIVISGNEAHTEQRITAITMVSNAPGAIAAVTRDGAVGTGNGGGLCVAGGTVKMYGGSITGNTAEGNGGGVAVRNLYYSGVEYDAEFDMISGSITNNTAGNLGGGIYANGEANTANKTKVYIGVENCTGEGPKHTSTHTDKTHPVVTANNADIGGGVAVEAGATVTVYCADINGNSATNDGRGDNVYSAGDALVLHDAATVGETTNHQLVVVSGIFQKAAQAVSVNLHYYQTNLDTTPGNTAQATAGEYFNLPDPSLMWSGNGIFLGWTFNGPTNTASPYVRKPSDYNMTMGTPLQAVDATDGHDDAEDAVHMYAVWAPQSSKITYTGCYIDGTYKSDALVTLDSGTYNYNEEQSLFTLPNVEMAGYTLQGWYLYQDEGQNANWGYEKSNMLRLNAGQQLDLGSGHFGDITLIPIYTENEVQISYHVSVPTGGNPSDFGYLTQGGNKINSGYAENVKVVTGKPGAVTAIANYRYIFKGWYADGVLITEDPVLTNAHLRKDAEGQLMSEDYYAVFDYHLDDLVINCAASGFFSGEQNFIYEVWCDDTLVTVVTLRNGESVTVRNLLINKEYTVKMMADWSWRFMDGTAVISKQITLEAGGNSVSFTSNQQRDIWLTHDTFAKTGNG